MTCPKYLFAPLYILPKDDAAPYSRAPEEARRCGYGHRDFYVPSVEQAEAIRKIDELSMLLPAIVRPFHPPGTSVIDPAIPYFRFRMTVGADVIPKRVGYS